jgi:type IV pilus assembly protein PilB
MSDATLDSRRKNHPLITRLLRSIDTLDPDRLELLWQCVGERDATLEESIVRCGVASDAEIAQSYAAHYLIPLFDPPAGCPPPIDPRVATRLPAQWCRDRAVAPLNDDGDILEVAIASPDSLLLADEIKWLTGRQMRPMFASLSVIETLIENLYGDREACRDPEATNSFGTRQDESGQAFPTTIAAGRSGGQDAPDASIRCTKTLLKEALVAGASDIHVEPYAETFRVRFRVEGCLREAGTLSATEYGDLARHLKRLAKMDLAQTRLPQHGSAVLRAGGRRQELRLNTCPTVHGEKFVIGIREPEAGPRDLDALGLDSRQHADLIESICNPDGLVLFAGPAGSGKTTTLRACLNALNDDATNLCSVEDSVPLPIEGINQVQTDDALGLTYCGAVQAFLDQDPDVIMVGELCDRETAQLCARAASHGRLVLSAFNTRDAFEGIDRLRDLELHPALLADTLRTVVAQRLVRRLCNQCKTPYRLDVECSRRFGIPNDIPVYRAGGCKRCRQTGYKGSLAVFEVVRITPVIKQLISTAAPADALRSATADTGVKRLWQIAAERVAEGQTSMEELIRHFDCGEAAAV